MPEYQQMSRAVEELKKEAVSKYEQYLHMKVKNIVGRDVPVDRRTC